jgi:hypothetical protein
MKKLIFAMLVILAHATGYSQDVNTAVRHYPGKVKYQKTEQDATIFELPYPKDEVEAGMKKMLGERGIKPREHNGFWEAKNVKILKLNSKVYDAYYKIEKDGKTASKVYMILTEPGEDVVARTSSHAVIAAAAGGTALAASVGSSMNDNNFDLRVKDQEADIKSAEKKYQNLLDDQKKLQKKMTDLQTELDKNTTDQTRLQQEIEAKKKILEDFKAGKKGKD